MSKLMRSKLFPALVIVIGALILVLPQVLAHKNAFWGRIRSSTIIAFMKRQCS